MATQADLDASRLYGSIMEEAKFRALSINTITGSGLEIPISMLREHCFLQLRMLCELIALGCLVAHGDISETKSKPLQKSYKADDIVKRLERLHPNFYPSPRIPIFKEGGGGAHFDYYDKEFLTKDDLVKLYGKCGDVLHRGSLKQMLNPNAQPPTDFQDIQSWGQKILNLLSVHLISRVGGDFHFVVFLDAQQTGGNVLVSIAESPTSRSGVGATRRG